MIDKRPFYAIIEGLKEFSSPDSLFILEAIEEGFSDIPAIKESEIRALKQYPIQYVKRITNDDGEWTTQLHIWAENGVPQIIDLDPIFLGFKNSYGDSVLMCVAIAATGTHTGHPDYTLMEKMLQRDYAYEEISVDAEGKEKTIPQNAMDETDINGKSPIDYIRDIAYATGDYTGEEPDFTMQQLLETYVKASREIEEQTEITAPVSETPPEPSQKTPENPV